MKGANLFWGMVAPHVWVGPTLEAILCISSPPFLISFRGRAELADLIPAFLGNVGGICRDRKILGI